MSKKLTTQEFIEKAKKVHGDRFDYTGVEYKGAHIPITIVCKDCGAIIKTTPHNHVVSGGCKSCRIINHTRTKEGFIEQARKVHGDKYNYDNVEYVHGETKVEITCKKHGAFLQTPNSHLQGAGCPKCAKEEMIRKATMTKEEFIAKAIAVHGNKYDYTDTVYSGVRNKIRVWCNQHKGYFEQFAATHLIGEGCQVCGGVYQPTTEEYIEMCKKVHGDKYIYDKTIYKNSNGYVWIKCDKHGYFQQKAGNHLHGCGCPDCGRDSQKEKMRNSREEFIEKAILAHPTENYDYSLVEYVNSYTPIKIICPKHGVFEQTPSCHLNGCGCQSCQRSMGELKIIEFLDKHSVSYEKQHKIKNKDLFCLTKTFICDFYIKDKNTIIEYNGQQHYRPSSFFGGTNSFIKQQNRDVSLRLYCNEHKIKLIEIPYTEFDNIEKILKKKLKL